MNRFDVFRRFFDGKLSDNDVINNELSGILVITKPQNILIITNILSLITPYILMYVPFFNSIALIEPKQRLGYLLYTCVRIEIYVRACRIEPKRVLCE